VAPDAYRFVSNLVELTADDTLDANRPLSVDARPRSSRTSDLEEQRALGARRAGRALVFLRGQDCGQVAAGAGARVVRSSGVVMARPSLPRW
jgi:hypothetical protein